MKRMQSPSSINTYRQCPRKYHFIYNLKLPTKPSIHLVRGRVAHSALENFFSIMPELIGDDYRDELHAMLLRLLKKLWDESKKDFDALGLSDSELGSFYEETQMMLSNWASQFNEKVGKLVSSGIPFADAFSRLKPKTEAKYVDRGLNVMGFIDAVEENDGEIKLVDYKTSKRAEINDAYRLQLAIYALLYERKHAKRPDKVGIFFLKDTEKCLDVDDEMILNAKFRIEEIHSATENTSRIDDYPKKESGLCKWAAGQCDFYEYCFKGKEIPGKK